MMLVFFWLGTLFGVAVEYMAPSASWFAALSWAVVGLLLCGLAPLLAGRAARTP